ncbi:hypothetical protein DdX_17618 [Ditylenchus destructor]|uniref:Uncharacterized protein n=1 Tax=Ditylenchus destructor TaxID=166010 RepID=A0AAD4QYU5_9BILA|nr:hypothetical protein DdX_17618 [Ditylenchus destructor]
MFNEELSVDEYNEWIVRNGYSKQIPLECQIAVKENTKNVRVIYEFSARIYKNRIYCRDIATTVFYARTELKDKNWPLFQHFIRLLMDPFICVRTLELTYQKNIFTFLAGAMNPDRDRLHCEQLIIYFNGDTQKFIKFMGLKNRDEYQLVESIRGNVKDREVVEALKRNCAEFIAEEEQFEEGRGTRQIIVFTNNDIGKKLTLNVKSFSFGRPSIVLIKTTNL